MVEKKTSEYIERLFKEFQDKYSFPFTDINEMVIKSAMRFAIIEHRGEEVKYPLLQKDDGKQEEQK